MRRYIDAENIEYTSMCRARGDGMYEDCEIAYKDEIDDIPTADVVNVIRCKDCKYHAKFSSKCNKLHLTPMRPNDYCSYGEREEHD